MKKLWSSLISGANSQKSISKLAICNKHNIYNYPNIIAAQQCISCQQQQCYLCSDSHIYNHCHVQLSNFIKPSFPSYKNNQNTSKLQMFNYGNLAKINLSELRCICNKKLEDQGAICAACGMASCSEECHHHWESQGYCTFHKNFEKKLKNLSLRSIIFKNILSTQNLNPKQFPIKINKTSSKFISCYSFGNFENIYLQRGYRIYGHPQQQLMEKMTLTQKNLDYYLNLQRACDCKCPVCLQRKLHSHGNCQLNCQSNIGSKIKDLLVKDQNRELCDCKCQHCASGIINVKHSKIQCYFQCIQAKQDDL